MEVPTRRIKLAVVALLGLALVVARVPTVALVRWSDDRTRPRVIRAWLVLATTMSAFAVTALVAGAAVGGTGTEGAVASGNANLHLGKTVVSGSFHPALNVSLAVDRSAAIPGDALSYQATLTNPGARVTLTGDLTAGNTGATRATVVSYWDSVATSSNPGHGCPTDHGRDTAQWMPFVSTAASRPGYTPVVPPPIATGMALSLTPVPASGVAYPARGDRMLGTTLAPGATATWHYVASFPLSVAREGFLLDPKRVTKLRNTLHAEVGPRNANATQPAFVDTCFKPSLFGGSPGTAADAKIAITPPTGAPVTFSAPSTPALASLSPGASVEVSTPYVVPAVAAKGENETDSAYLARLRALDGSALTASAAATAQSSGGPLSAGARPVTTTMHLPVLGITKTGPASADAGTTVDYELALLNSGSAQASSLSATDRASDGTLGAVGEVPPTLEPGGLAMARAGLTVPLSEPPGPLSDTASLSWRDVNGNAYGPVSSTFATTITGCAHGSTLTLAPQTAGPDVTGTSQTLSATFLNAGGNPCPDRTLSFAVTGANPTTVSASTDASGVATFTYTGSNSGTDTVQASFESGAFTLQSNTASVEWVTPIETISTTGVTGRFYSGGCGSFCADVSQPPLWTQSFPTIDFNPPGGTVPGNITGVGVDTRPFTDITTDAVGDFTGVDVAQGSGYQAGVGSLSGFDAVFTANYVVAGPGDVTFNFYDDDGFILGIGGGATRVEGALVNPPGSTPLSGYPVMGAFNDPTSPAGHSITVHFPSAGTYPYEVDYSECCGGQLALTMATSTGQAIAPAGNLALTPVNVPTQTVGQPLRMTVAAMDASGQPIANLPLTMTVSGVNGQTVTGETNSSGLAVLSYTGNREGSDLVLVGASVSGAPAVSNTVGVSWAFGESNSTAKLPPLVGEVSPEDGAVITKPVPVKATISPSTGETITSWKVTEQALGQGPPAVIASGSGAPPATLGTFDPTLLANATYRITVFATASGGGTQSVSTTVAVQGNLKLGRYTTTYQDLVVPVNGFQMAVRRVYDSIDRQSGDFGVGWHLELSNFRVSANRELGAGGWSEYPTSCIFGLCFWAFKTSSPHYVTVTWPGGRQEVFDFTPSGGAAVFYSEGSAAFTARAGTNTTSTLAVDGETSLTNGFDGNIYGGSGIYNPTRFKLTTNDGRKLILDTTLGLISEEDPNGNSLNVDANGVHSTLGPAPGTPGPSIAFTRDPTHGNRITEITGPVTSQHVQYGYNPSGELESVTDPDGNTDTYKYDSAGALELVSDPRHQPLQTLKYDEEGRLKSIANGSQPPTKIETNVSGLTQTLLDPNGKLTTVLHFDELGDVLERDDSFNGKTLRHTYTYDPVGRMTSATDPLKHTTSVSYDESNGNVMSTTDAMNRELRYENFNSFGEPETVRRPDKSVLENLTYDPTTGELLSTDQPGAEPTTYTYNPAGQLKSVTEPGGRTTTYGYDPSGNLETISDGRHHTVQVKVNAAGQLESITDQLGDVTEFRYTPGGQLAQVTDPNGNSSRFFYDALDRLERAEDPLHKSALYEYNALGLLAKRTDRNGGITKYTYNIDGLLTAEERPSKEALNFSYDPLGHLEEADNSAGHIDRTYNEDGLLEGETTCANTGSPAIRCGAALSPTQPIVSLKYGYWPDNQLQSVSSSDAGAVNYAYDPDGRLEKAQDPSGVFGFEYNSLGQLASLKRPNHVDDVFAYTAAGDLERRDAVLSGTTIAPFDYEIDPLTGRRESLIDIFGKHTFSYYDNGALKSASHPPSSGLANETYAYDKAGNRISGTGIVGTAKYDAADRLLSDGNFNYTYDEEGDLQTKTPVGGGPSTTYEWGGDHELVAIHLPDGSTSTYRYDPVGRRVAAVEKGKETRFVYEGSRVSRDYNSHNELQTSYLSGLDSRTPSGQSSYLLEDGLGNVRALTNEAGAVTGTYAYNSFGVPASTNAEAGRDTFGAYQYDSASGLYDAGARYYDPTTGRFLSKDPVASVNPYPYVVNDPIDLVDPEGRQAAAEYADLVQSEADAAGCISNTVAAIAEPTGKAIGRALEGIPVSEAEVRMQILQELIVTEAGCIPGKPDLPIKNFCIRNLIKPIPEAGPGVLGPAGAGHPPGADALGPKWGDIAQNIGITEAINTVICAAKMGAG
jgi:RHS repeat-associated protein